MSHIKVPTLLFRGSNDEAVSAHQMAVLEQHIPDSALIELEGASHYGYLDKPEIVHSGNPTFYRPTVMFLILFAVVFASIFAGWRVWRRVRFFLHVFQLESYKPRRYVRWVLRRSKGRVVRVSHLIGFPVLLASWFLYAENGVGWALVAVLFMWGIFFSSSRHYKGSAQKKPLAFTNRLKRLRTCALAIVAILFLVVGWIGFQTGTREGFFYIPLAFFIADLAAPLWVYLATLIMHPVERSIQNGYKKQARKKLAGMPKLVKVGITGSYGKTSVKFIVAEILRQRFNVLATPGSYNTPMGICIVGNNHLMPDHQVLVLEMGMRYRGDIRELCAIARPEIYRL